MYLPTLLSSADDFAFSFLEASIESDADFRTTESSLPDANLTGFIDFSRVCSFRRGDTMFGVNFDNLFQILNIYFFVLELKDGIKFQIDGSIELKELLFDCLTT